MGFSLLADAVLLLHLAVVLFVIGGLLVVLVGNRRGWAWVNRGLFRIAHLGAIAFVAAQAWLGQECPLTTLESALRLRAGEAGYAKGFIEDWVHRILFYEAPGWVFAALYSGFGLLVAAAWWRWPPRWR
jgi:hypothetical protein